MIFLWFAHAVQLVVLAGVFMRLVFCQKSLANRAIWFVFQTKYDALENCRYFAKTMSDII